MESNVPVECEMPGMNYDFEDVTSVFLQAGTEMEPNSLVFLDGFTLQESMSALEIGEPRLDSGLIIPEQVRPLFNPSQPLLPEEICWIMDRALAFEMEFYSGNFLAHTVHTLLYTHFLSLIDPGHFITPSYAVDPARPHELITVVLRASVQGLLKCCDLTWRCLSNGGVYDTEDWQSDKSEVSLLEGMPVENVVAGLDAALRWLVNTEKVPMEWKSALQSRLLLRRSFLVVLHVSLPRNPIGFQSAIRQARDHLALVKSIPSPECGANSPAQLAFDPYIGRQLQMASPIRVISPPSFPKTCETVAQLLDDLEQVGLLASVHNISTWKIVGNLRQQLPDYPQQLPYVRSLAQITFCDGFLVFSKYIAEWISDRFFYETVGVRYSSIRASVMQRWMGDDEPPLKKLERLLYKLIIPHVKCLWSNPPRRRRHLMKSVSRWHVLYDVFVQIRDMIDVSDLPVNSIENHFDKISLLWQFSNMREIVLSGFQLELYAKEEKAFAYWYAACIIEAHLNCLNSLLPTLLQGTDEENEYQERVYNEMLYQVQYLTAVQSICLACSIVSMPLMSFEWKGLLPNFYRRYKWAFTDSIDACETPLLLKPSLARFVKICGEALRSDDPVPSEPIALARSLLVGLVETRNSGGWANIWSNDRIKLSENLIAVCDNLAGLPRTGEEMDKFDAKVLKWDPQFHPWFPRLRTGNE